MEKKRNKKIPIKFSIIGAPLYECSLITVNKKEGLEIMNQALEEIKEVLKLEMEIIYLKQIPKFQEKVKKLK